MDFVVFDNKFTFEKRILYNGNPLSRIPIEQVLLPEHGAFWFYTNTTKELANVDIHAPFVHLFPGVQSANTMQFDKDPVEVTKDMLKYNPKTKQLEIRNSVLPWKKPLWTKNCKFYGELPNKITSALGMWYYDSYIRTIYITLDYFAEPPKFKVQSSYIDVPDDLDSSSEV